MISIHYPKSESGNRLEQADDQLGEVWAFLGEHQDIVEQDGELISSEEGKRVKGWAMMRFPEKQAVR